MPTKSELEAEVKSLEDQVVRLEEQLRGIQIKKDEYDYHLVIMRFRLLYSMAGLVLGLVCVLGGILLFIRGVSGATSWTANLVGVESKVTDAAPGAVLFIVGLFLVVATRYKWRSRGSVFSGGPD